jgi:hypothetical protein
LDIVAWAVIDTQDILGVKFFSSSDDWFSSLFTSFLVARTGIESSTYTFDN